MLKLNARPEPVEIDWEKSAVVVVDMQNSFASRQGMLDLAGFDISGAPQVVRSIASMLDAELRQRGIRYLFFTGIATNVCVESTLRDAYFLDYWPILITDGAMAAGPPAMHEATVQNVENFFGWTVTAAEFIQSVRMARAAGGMV